jgi:uncharacterized membrane protein (DUF2068 family)
MNLLKKFLGVLRKLRLAFTDLLPIILVISFFQFFVIKQSLPQIGDVIFGGLLVVVGLMLFIEGLEMGLFPIGDAMANSLAQKGSAFWLFTFSFLLGFSTTIAEPALVAVAEKAANVAKVANLISSDDQTIKLYALGLRISVALSVGFAVVLGVLRIIKGWPLHYLIIGGYFIVMIMTIFAPKEIIGLAFDSGGVTTSTITVPLVTALGVGLATIIKGRNPLLDGFGLIAFASLMPMIFVMIYGLFWF